ncbi:hypothetical protein DPMN_181490 [Dreissena polymorpha]|uniref:B box-type domain-containing protein n=1 Tax=Dreissena polymorpha TaxID=45954 RepID=A0A9D4I4G3_DREPO|nr:hypothetical protein DPMN_181490 [Dreissena polymorpha]
MATCSQFSVDTSSGVVMAYRCSMCEEQNSQTCDLLYCEECVKYYCEKCAQRHRHLFTHRTTYRRDEAMKGTVFRKAEDSLLSCELHADMTLELFCERHGQLCCSECVSINHSGKMCCEPSR